MLLIEMRVAMAVRGCKTTAVEPDLYIAEDDSIECFACLNRIHKGEQYISLPDREGGRVEICSECVYLMTQTTKHELKCGQFSERYIPNCLRKKRNAFREDYDAAEAEIDTRCDKIKKEQHLDCLRVSSVEYERHIYLLPADEYNTGNFIKRQKLRIDNIDTNKSRFVFVKGIWEVDSKGLIVRGSDRKGKLIALLVG